MKSVDDALELRGRIFGAFELAELGARRGEDVDAPAHLRGGRRRPDRRRDGRPDRRAGAAHPAPRLPRHQLARGPGRPRRRRRPGAAAVRGQAGASRPSGRSRSSASRCGSARWSPTSTSAASRSRTRTARVERIEAVTKMWAAGVQASSLTATLSEQTGAPARPRRPDRRQPRPHPARPPRGVRRRRHDRPRPPARRRAGRDPGREVRREGDRPPAGRASRRRSRSSTSTRARWPRSAGSARWR